MSEEPLRVWVADDEVMARKRLIRLLAELPRRHPGIQLMGECADGHAVLRCVREGNIDVLLLDIQMPGLSGLEALSLAPAERPLVIFCTAHAKHAVDAFELGAIDYLLKPIEAARLQKAMDRAQAAVAQRHLAAPGSEKPQPGPPWHRLALPTHQGIVLLDPQDVSHAIVEGSLVKVVTTTGDFFSSHSLSDLEGRLPAAYFMRVHRRALLNLARIRRLEPNEVGGFLARTLEGHAVEVSRQAARALRKRLRM